MFPCSVKRPVSFPGCDTPTRPHAHTSTYKPDMILWDVYSWYVVMKLWECVCSRPAMSVCTHADKLCTQPYDYFTHYTLRIVNRLIVRTVNRLIWCIQSRNQYTIWRPAACIILNTQFITHVGSFIRHNYMNYSYISVGMWKVRSCSENISIIRQYPLPCSS